MSVATMKPIETRYKGYRFRSRLEARWAVFFDALIGSAWEYEPEGFKLSDGSLYLPDFRLGQDLWVEIKPTAPTDEEERKAELLAKESGLPVAIGMGQPVYGVLWLYCLDISDSSGGWNWWTECQWRAVKGEDLLCIGVETTSPDRSFVTDKWAASGIIKRWDQSEDLPLIARAAEKARGARFEHGEGR